MRLVEMCGGPGFNFEAGLIFQIPILLKAISDWNETAKVDDLNVRPICDGYNIKLILYQRESRCTDNSIYKEIENLYKIGMATVLNKLAEEA